ncbi:GtrA family protein [Congregibacter sp.]|uniref:GtrA family protein n=1 Tax=Congregibacter sp. TaxID=2744308 RepID=UPI003F6BD752
MVPDPNAKSASATYIKKCRTIYDRFCSALPLSQFLRFLVNGGLATLLHWSVMAFLIARGLDAFVATCAGAVFGAIAAYVLQYQFTFGCTAAHGHTSIKFSASAGLSWSLNALLFHAMHHVAGIPTALAQGLTTVVTTATNYVVYRYLVFTDLEQTPDA